MQQTHDDATYYELFLLPTRLHRYNHLLPPTTNKVKTQTTLIYSTISVPKMNDVRRVAMKARLSQTTLISNRARGRCDVAVCSTLFAVLAIQTTTIQ